PDGEHGAVVHAFAGAHGNGDHVARATAGEHVGHRQHAGAAVIGLLRGRVREELQVVGLGVDRHQAVADAHFIALVIQQHGGGLDAAHFAAGHGARTDAHHLVAQHFLALVGHDHVGPELAAVHDPTAAEVEVFGVEQVAAEAAALQMVVAHGWPHDRD